MATAEEAEGATGGTKNDTGINGALETHVNSLIASAFAERRHVRAIATEESDRADREARARRSAESRCATLREEKQNASDRAHKAEAERDALSAQLQHSLSELRKAERAHEADTHDYSQQIESALADARRQSAHARLLEDEVHKLNRNARELQHRCETLSTQINACNESVHNANGAIERREKQVASLEQKIFSEEAQASSSGKSAATSSGRNIEAGEESQIQATKAAQEEAIREHEQRRQLELDLQQQKERIQAQDELISYLQQQLQARNDRLDSLKALLREQRENDNNEVHRLSLKEAAHE